MRCDEAPYKSSAVQVLVPVSYFNTSPIVTSFVTVGVTLTLTQSVPSHCKCSPAVKDVKLVSSKPARFGGVYVSVSVPLNDKLGFPAAAVVIVKALSCLIVVLTQLVPENTRKQFFFRKRLYRRCGFHAGLHRRHIR